MISPTDERLPFAQVPGVFAESSSVQSRTGLRRGMNPAGSFRGPSPVGAFYN